MNLLWQINGPSACPPFEHMAHEKGFKTLWMPYHTPYNKEQLKRLDFHPDLIVVQYVAHHYDLRELGWDKLGCPIIGWCGDAAVLTNLPTAYKNLEVMTKLYVDGQDYIDLYYGHHKDKLVYHKFCAEIYFPPLDLPKEYDWTFIGQVYPEYDTRLKHYRSELIPAIYQRHPNGFVAGSDRWSELLGITTRFWLPQGELNAYYAKSRVVVSIDAHDGSGYTSTRFIEALHGGHCVLAHDHQGMPFFKQFIEDGKHALYFRTLDEFSERLEWVRQNPLKAKEIGAAGREVILQKGWTTLTWWEKVLTEFSLANPTRDRGCALR